MLVNVRHFRYLLLSVGHFRYLLLNFSDIFGKCFILFEEKKRVCTLDWGCNIYIYIRPSYIHIFNVSTKVCYLPLRLDIEW